MAEPYELYLAEERAPLRVLRLRVKEGMNEPYRARVTCLSAEPARLAGAALGRPATLVFTLDGAASRHTQAIVTASGVGARGPDGGSVDLVLEPRLAKLRLRQRRRVFQDMTSVAIAAAVLGEHGALVRPEVIRAVPLRPYTVQVDETDFDFVHRLLADDGIFYFFDQPDRVVAPHGGDPPVETIVLADATASYPRATPAELAHRSDEDDGTFRTADNLYRVRLRHRAELERVHVSGLDFQRPSTELDDEARIDGAVGGPVALERVTHELAWETRPTAPGPASVELEQHRRGTMLLSAKTTARHLSPGTIFHLGESLEPELCGDWVVVEAEHRGSNAERGGAARGAVYDGRIKAVPSGVSYRPDRPKRPAFHGVETATVVGPRGESVFTDEYGRVRVRFPWETDVSSDHSATTWLRVSQPWGGPGFGAQFLPRVGSLVVVDFVGGDPDRPIIVGSLYDGARPFPFGLPENRTQTGIRTATVGAAGSNELLFEDRAGLEQVSLRGQRTVVLTSGADMTQEVGENHRLTVTGASNVRIGGAAEQNITGALINTIGGALSETTGHAGIERHGNQIVHVDGNRFDKTGGAVEERVGGAHQLLVGTTERAYSLTTVNGTCVTRSSGILTLASDEAIVLQVGESTMTIGPKQIRLSSPEVLVTSPALKLHGEDGKEYIELGQGIRLKSDTITAHAPGGALLLDGGARLEGNTVAFASLVSKAADAEVDSSEESGLVTFEFKNLDPATPSTAMVLMPSGKVEEHPIPSSGVLQIEGRPGERFSLVDLRVDGASMAKTRA